MPAIVYYSGAPGAGKSTQTKENVVLQPGLHLYIVSLVRSVTEVTEDLDRLRKQHNVAMTLHPFFADQAPAKVSACPELVTARRKGGSVRKRIVDRALKCRPDDHAAYVITHSSFMAIEPYIFAGWTLHIDEIPHSSVLSGTVYNPVLWRAYGDLYELQPIENSKFSRLVLSSTVTVAPIDVMSEPGFSDADKTLFARVCSPTPVFIEAREFTHLGARRCRWYSAWSLAECEDFAHIEIAASDLRDSLMFRLNPVDLVDHPIEAKPSLAKIRITYYDDGDQRCSAAFFETEQGRNNLRLIAKHIESQGGVDFWTTNSSSAEFLKPLLGEHHPVGRPVKLYYEPGTRPVGYINPLCEGTNTLRELTSCAMLYSSKAQAHETVYTEIAATASIAEAVSKQNIAQHRELSALNQFVTRSKARDRTFAGEIEVHVYDMQQAEGLKDKLQSNLYLDVLTNHIDLDGFENRSVIRPGPKTVPLTPEERQQRERVLARERKREQRERDKGMNAAAPRRVVGANTMSSGMPRLR